MMWGKGKPNRYLFLHSIILWDFYCYYYSLPRQSEKVSSGTFLTVLFMSLVLPGSTLTEGGGAGAMTMWRCCFSITYTHTRRASYFLSHITLSATPGAGTIVIPIHCTDESTEAFTGYRTCPSRAEIHTQTGVIPTLDFSATLQDSSLIGCLALSHFSALFTVFIHSPPSSLPDSYWFLCMMVPLASNGFAISSPIFKWTFSSVV